MELHINNVHVRGYENLCICLNGSQITMLNFNFHHLLLEKKILRLNHEIYIFLCKQLIEYVVIKVRIKMQVENFGFLYKHLKKGGC